MGPALESLRNATARELLQAIVINHQELFGWEAIRRGGSIHEVNGVAWTYSGPAFESMILFPELTETNASPILDKILNSYLQHPPKGAGCWSLDPVHPADLGTRLLARGFRPGWRPCWMVLDLDKINDNHPAPTELRIIADNSRRLEGISDLPYKESSCPPDENLIPGKAQPKRMQRFIGILNGEVVAHTSVLFTTGPHGVAGIYNVGVVPSARNRGIAKAVLIATCKYARENGYGYATLNATGRRMYEQVGFRWIGDGWTWWLNGNQFLKHPPSKQEVKLAEAVGRGDIDTLDNLFRNYTRNDLNQPLTNGLTLMELAVHCQQPAAAYWLLDHGIELRILEAWTLGWHEKAKEIIATHPAHVNDLYGELSATILHEAARINDRELAKLSLSAGPDLEIKDSEHGATPMDWARFFNRKEIIRLIEDHTK